MAGDGVMGGDQAADVVLRDAHPGDAAAWRALWAGYLDFYRVTLDEAMTQAVWDRVFADDSRLAMRVAEVGGAVSGFAIYHTHETTWRREPDVYLEDLYLAPEMRGRGIGAALIDDLIALARARGWGRLYWLTEVENARARALYDRYAVADHVRYRVEL